MARQSRQALQGLVDPFGGLQAENMQRGGMLPDLGMDMTAQMNPQWARWFDTIKANTGGKTLRFAPQPNLSESSNQFRGWSTQPSLMALNELVTPTAGHTRTAAATPGAEFGRKRKKYNPDLARLDSPDTQYRF